MIKILVIEDEIKTSKVFLECLETRGFEGIEAKNGHIGVQKAQEKLPDLVVCDILLPELDGYGVLKTLRQEPATAIIPFILLTSNINRAELRQVMQLGADDYLPKASTQEEFLAAIATQIEKRKNLKKLYNSEFQESSSQRQDSSSPVLPLNSNPQIQKIFDYIEAHYQESIGLNDVANTFGYSSAYLTDWVKRQTGKTVKRWIIERRLTAVKALLLETDYPVNKIAEETGYLNPSHLHYQFRQYIGDSPNSWRKAHQIC